jgi:hypothetical protein
MPRLESLTFDLGDCEQRRLSETVRLWIRSDHVAYCLKFNSGVIYWPFDLTDLSAAREFYRRECEENAGVMLEMDLVTVACAEALSGVFKYRSPMPGSLGMMYVGILWLPFHNCWFQINVEALELGTTGRKSRSSRRMSSGRSCIATFRFGSCRRTLRNTTHFSHSTRSHRCAVALLISSEARGLVLIQKIFDRIG